MSRQEKRSSIERNPAERNPVGLVKLARRAGLVLGLMAATEGCFVQVEKPDGDTGTPQTIETGTIDTGDSEPIDTGTKDTGDTEKPDTGDTAIVDTGEKPDTGTADTGLECENNERQGIAKASEGYYDNGSDDQAFQSWLKEHEDGKCFEVIQNTGQSNHTNEEFETFSSHYDLTDGGVWIGKVDEGIFISWNGNTPANEYHDFLVANPEVVQAIINIAGTGAERLTFGAQIREKDFGDGEGEEYSYLDEFNYKTAKLEFDFDWLSGLLAEK